MNQWLPLGRLIFVRIWQYLCHLVRSEAWLFVLFVIDVNTTNVIRRLFCEPDSVGKRYRRNVFQGIFLEKRHQPIISMASQWLTQWLLGCILFDAHIQEIHPKICYLFMENFVHKTLIHRRLLGYTKCFRSWCCDWNSLSSVRELSIKRFLIYIWANWAGKRAHVE